MPAPTRFLCPATAGPSSTAAIWTEIVGTVERRTEVFVGGRVRSGLELLKFLRLSAKACFIDRACLGL